MAENEPPSNPEAEYAVLGALIEDPKDCMPLAVSVLGSDVNCFFMPTHRAIYATLLRMFSENIPISFESLFVYLSQIGVEERRVGGRQYVLSSICASTATSNVEHYSKMIIDCYRRRLFIAAIKKAEAIAYNKDTPLEDARQLVDDSVSSASAVGDSEKTEHISVLAEKERERLAALGRGEIGKGIKSGIDTIDALMMPMQPGNYIIIAASTSIGKTTLACNIALNAAEEGVGVLIFSMEMTKQAIINKLLCIKSKVNMFKVEYDGKMGVDDKQKIDDALNEMKKMTILIDDESGLTPAKMRAKAKAAASRSKIGLIVVDYIQLMHVPKAENETCAVGSVSKNIKAMAKELGVPVIALSQLNRDGAKEKPELRHLRQSGSLEQDCDIAILLHREGDVSAGDVTAYIAKQRIGPTGASKMNFRKSEQRFYSGDGSGKSYDRAPKAYTRQPDPEPINHQIEYDYFEEDDTPF